MKGGEGKGDERGECGSVCVWGGQIRVGLWSNKAS